MEKSLNDAKNIKLDKPEYIGTPSNIGKEERGTKWGGIVKDWLEGFGKGLSQTIRTEIGKEVRNIKVPTPQVTVNPKIKVPEIKIPEIRIPKIEVPEINIPKQEVLIPEVTIKGFDKQIVSLLEEIKKNRPQEKVSDGPLKVVLIDPEKGTKYKAQMTAVSHAGGGGSTHAKIYTADGTVINPATSDKQLANDHDVTVSNQITGFATSAKQLADDHNVTVSNPTTNPETGLATSAKQDTIIGEVEALASPTTTALTLTTENTQYKMPASELANRRLLVIYNVSDTDVYIGSSSVTTTNGILLETGGTMTVDCEKDLYAVCGTASKIINLLEMA